MADPTYASGPGRRRRTPGPVIDAYADANIHEQCTGCGAPAFSFCRHPDGTERKMPCRQRLSPQDPE